MPITWGHSLKVLSRKSSEGILRGGEGREERKGGREKEIEGGREAGRETVRENETESERIENDWVSLDPWVEGMD